MARKLENTIAVVTGGTSGIGLATVRILAEHGARVAVIGRDAAKFARERTAPAGAEFVTADTARPAELKDAMGEIARRFGRFDVLFANAGVSDTPELEDFDEAAFDRVMDVNVKGTFFTIVYAMPHLAERASIVITSSAAHDRGSLGDPLYAASKAACRSLGRTFAANPKLLLRGVRVNVVSPGPIDTPMTAGAIANAEANEYVRSIVPLKRWGRADEVARAVLFLASDDSSYTTGAEIAVDGGMAQV